MGRTEVRTSRGIRSREVVEETEEVNGAESQPEVREEPVERANESSELTREEASARLEAIFRSNLEGQELEKLVASIDKRLDKFEGKWPKLVLWAEEKYGPASKFQHIQKQSTPKSLKPRKSNKHWN